MQGTITALKVQANNKERVNLYLDGEFAFGLSLFIAHGLKPGQTLEAQEIAQLRLADEQEQAYNKAIYYLSFRPRSSMEIRDYLAKKEFAAEAVATTIDRLLKEQYLDDEEFARLWLADRTKLRPRGERGLRYELRRKGIAEEIIERVLVDLDEHAAAWRAIESKLRRWRKLPRYELKKKLFGFLQRRGFSYDSISAAFERAWQQHNPD